MDVEKTMQFLLEQQARFDARQAEFDARHAEFNARHGELLASQSQSVGRIKEIESILVDIATAQTRTNEILTTLTERHVELTESHRVTQQNLNALSAAQRVTEHNLNALSEAQRVTQRSLRTLSEAQRATEQNLNALMSALERHIASHG